MTDGAAGPGQRNTLAIQHYDEEIAALQAKVQRLVDEDHAKPTPGFYVCTRCGLFYQSPWGCGCPKEAQA